MLTVRACRGSKLPFRSRVHSLRRVYQYNTPSGLTLSCSSMMLVRISLFCGLGIPLIFEVSSLTVGPRVGEAMKRSVRWLDRCIEFHEKSGRKDVQNLFAIVQGGLDPVLRDECLDEMVKRRDEVAGYAIGGLSGGEEKGMSLTSPHRPFLCVDESDLIRYILANVGSLFFLRLQGLNLK